MRSCDFSAFRGRRIAHRGLHDLSLGRPENTLPAFRAAAEGGYGAELDVRLTADGRLAVLHDGDLRRPCGQDLAAADLTEAVRRDLRVFGSGERIPLLEEVLPLFAGRGPLVIELKTDRGNARALTEAVCRMLPQFPVTFCLESFDPRVLLALRRLRPDLCRGQLSCDFFRPENPNALLPPVRTAMTRLWTNPLTRPDFIAYKWEDRGCAAVARARRRGLPEFSWTIRRARDLLAAERAGCFPIFEGFRPAPLAPA